MGEHSRVCSWDQRLCESSSKTFFVHMPHYSTGDEGKAWNKNIFGFQTDQVA